MQKIKRAVAKLKVTINLKNILVPFYPGPVGMATGTAFHIKVKNEQNSKFLLTCYHCIENAKEIEVTYFEDTQNTSKKYYAKVIHRFPNHDVAILELINYEHPYFVELHDEKKHGALRNLKNNIENVQMTNDKMQTMNINAVGYPLTSTVPKVSEGYVVSFDQGVEVSAPLNPGNSGGPIFHKGRVIAIAKHLMAGRGVLNPTSHGAPIEPIVRLIERFQLLSKNSNIKKPIFRVPNIGITTNHIFDEKHGYNYFQIQGIQKESPADQQDIPLHSKIIQVDEFNINSQGLIVTNNTEPMNFQKYIQQKVDEDAIVLRYITPDNNMIQNARIQLYYNNMNERRAYRPRIRKYCDIEIDTIDYEAFGGCIVQPLIKNVLDIFNQVQMPTSTSYHMNKYNQFENKNLDRVIITKIFPDSLFFKSQILSPGHIMKTINGKRIRTLADYRKALFNAVRNHIAKTPISRTKAVIVQSGGHYALPDLSSHIIVVTEDDHRVEISVADLIEKEVSLTQMYHYKSKISEILHI